MALKKQAIKRVTGNKVAAPIQRANKVAKPIAKATKTATPIKKSTPVKKASTTTKLYK